jgi:uncharacterized protein YcbK (DUF882 family)
MTTLKESTLTLKYFTLDEFNCKETGENKMSHNFLIMLDRLREECDFPFVITSGYRSPQHSVEKDKLTKGRHTQGIAADIAVSNGYQRYKIVEKAIELGFKGIGVAGTVLFTLTYATLTPLLCGLTNGYYTRL